MSVQSPTDFKAHANESQTKRTIEAANMDERFQLLEQKSKALELEVIMLRKDNDTKNMMMQDELKALEKELAQMKEEKAVWQATEKENQVFKNRVAVLEKVCSLERAGGDQRGSQKKDVKQGKSHTKDTTTKPSKKEAGKSKGETDLQKEAMAREIENLKIQVKELEGRNQVREQETVAEIEEVLHKRKAEEDERMEAFKATKSEEMADMTRQVAGLKDLGERCELAKTREIEKLKSEIERLEEYRDASQSMEGQIKDLTTKLAASEEQFKALESSQAHDIGELRKEVQSAEADAQSKAQEIEKLKERAKRVEGDALILSEGSGKLKKQVAEQVAELERTVAELRRDMTTMVSKKLMDMRTQALNRKLEAKVNELEVEKERTAEKGKITVQKERPDEKYNSVVREHQQAQELYEDLQTYSDAQDVRLEKLKELLESIFNDIDDFNTRSQDPECFGVAKYQQRLEEILPALKNPYLNADILTLASGNDDIDSIEDNADDSEVDVVSSGSESGAVEVELTAEVESMEKIEVVDEIELADDVEVLDMVEEVEGVQSADENEALDEIEVLNEFASADEAELADEVKSTTAGGSLDSSDDSLESSFTEYSTVESAADSEDELEKEINAAIAGATLWERFPYYELVQPTQEDLYTQSSNESIELMKMVSSHVSRTWSFFVGLLGC